MKTPFRAALALLVAALCLTPAAAQTDPFKDFNDSVSAQCTHWTTITPSDSADLTTIPKAIYVGGAGDIAMIGAKAPPAATGVTWKAVPASALLPVRPRRILATGTNATFLIACL